MYAIVYLLSAFGLIRYCFSQSYRTECHARWQKTPKYRIVIEIGCGVIGLLLIGFLLMLIFSRAERSMHNQSVPDESLQRGAAGSSSSRGMLYAAIPAWLGR
jgi:hypothetical protein